MIIVLCLALILVGESVLGQLHLKEVSCATNLGATGVCMHPDECHMSNIDSSEEEQCGLNEICCPPTEDGRKPTPTLDEQDPRCGVPNGKQRTRYSETPIEVENYPWIAALGYKLRTKNKQLPSVTWHCAGSLINKRFVLTAASCVRVPADFPYQLKVVRLGEFDLLNAKDGAQPVDYGIKHTIVHRHYSPREKIYDIALIRLKRDVAFTDRIYPICLPTPSLLKVELDDQRPIEAGWGAYGFQGHLRDTLHHLVVSQIDQEQCRRLYSREGYIIRQEIQVCGVNITIDGQDNCVSDVGGPLMMPMNAPRFYLLGLFSFGDHCAETGLPRVYTRVSGFLKWISANAVDK